MNSIKEKLPAGITGVATGILSCYFINGWYNVIPWAVVALLIGYCSKSRNMSLIKRAIFGYFLFVAYVIAGYKGSYDPQRVLKFVGFAVVFSLIGSVIVAAGGYGGFLMKKKPA